MPLDPGVVDGVINTNFKNLAEAAGAAQALAYQNAVANQQVEQADIVSHQRIVNGLREVVFGQLAKRIAELDIAEAVAEKKTGEQDLARSLAELSTTVANNTSQLGEIIAVIQQLVKGAQTTPPQTGQGG